MRKKSSPFSVLSSFFTKMLLSFLALSLCFGCFGNAIASANGEVQGKTQVPAFPQRIVVFPLFAEEMLLEMIEPDRIVYVGHKYWENGEAHSPTMELTKYIPGNYWQNCDIEQILDLKPDLVVLPGILSSEYEMVFPELVQENIAVLFLDIPETIEDITNTLTTLGEVVGASEKAAQMVHDMESALAQITEIVSSVSEEKRIRVVHYEDWQYGFPMVARAAGVINANKSQEDYLEMDSDLLVEWNPDLLTIVPVYYDTDGSIYDISDDFVDKYISFILNNPILSDVTAIKNQNVHPLRVSESQFVVKSVKDLARLAYPDLFPEKEK